MHNIINIGKTIKIFLCNDKIQNEDEKNFLFVLNEVNNITYIVVLYRKKFKKRITILCFIIYAFIVRPYKYNIFVLFLKISIL